MQPLRAFDVNGFERFTDLARVVKLQAESRKGELGDGTLHSMLPKKLTDRQLESYTRWTTEYVQKTSVLSLNKWLKEEVSIKVEAREMAHGLGKKKPQIPTSLQRIEMIKVNQDLSSMQDLNKDLSTLLRNPSFLVPSVKPLTMAYGIVKHSSKSQLKIVGILQKRRNYVSDVSEEIIMVKTAGGPNSVTLTAFKRFTIVYFIARASQARHRMLCLQAREVSHNSLKHRHGNRNLGNNKANNHGHFSKLPHGRGYNERSFGICKLSFNVHSVSRWI